MQFLKNNPELETLTLDLAYESNGFIEELASSITNSPIKKLDLGNTHLDSNAYNALDSLLDNNYYLQLSVPNADHENEELHDRYTQLAQRAAKKGHKRFREEQLTQHKLLIIAENVLRKKRGLTDFFKQCNNLPMTTDRMDFDGISEYVP